MKTKRIFGLILVLIIVFCDGFIYPQDFVSQCPMISQNSQLYKPANLIGGFKKPHRTDQNGAPKNARFNVLLVFVQFADEEAQSDQWPIGQPPIFKDQLLAAIKDTIGNYWDRYDENNEMLSDWYQEVSKGQMHVTGTAYNVILSRPSSYYQSQGMQVMNQEIIDSLKTKDIIWSDYDLWSGDLGNYYYQRDGYVDMIIKAHRTKKNTGVLFYSGAPGYCFLGDYYNTNNFQVDSITYINDNYSNIGSGITIVGTAGGPLDKNTVFNIAKHEIGHYWFGLYHTGAGVGIMGGGEIYLGGYESFSLGYLEYIPVEFNTDNYSLGDMISRNSSGELLKIPVGLDEHFLIENRRGISKYDRTMLGDTAKGDFTRNVSDYGKGLYIYHYYNFNTNDLECADGLWNWSYTGQTLPDWNYTQLVDVYERISLSYPLLNDNSDVSYSNKDGRTCGHNTSLGPSYDVYFGRGKKHETLNGEATAKLFTNRNELWTSREYGGDRWDAFNLGYNEVFSPYSNPSSIRWNDSASRVFVYYYGYDNNNNKALLKIYKPQSDNELNYVLAQTPPSRPMGLTLDTCFDAGNGISYIKLNWVHNMEPDMERGSKAKYKRYKIYRSFSTSATTVPPDSYLYPENHYTVIDTVDINSNVTPSYVDSANNPKIYSVCAYLPDVSCPPICYNLVNVRYRVQAVDMYDSVSRLSDFDQCQGYRKDSTGGIPIGSGEDFLPHKGNTGDKIIPKEFKLSQNFPNPFNPNTNICYDIPHDCFVTIKIYDVSGREIKSLIDEFIKAGSYITGFNGSGLASGVYFYKITAGSFVQTKRMALIK